jgi:signal transduction histidine kinase
VVYAVCALAVVEGLAWITWHAVRLEQREAAARAEAAHQEMVRLALWRMDSILIPLISREDGTPYFHYRSFHSEQQAYNAMYQPLPPDAILVPSPLLVDSGEFVRLHFELDGAGSLASPEAPTGNQRDEAEAHYVSSDRVIEAERRLDELRALLGPDPRARLELRAPSGATRDELVEAQTGVTPGLAQSDEEFDARRQVANLAREAVESTEGLLRRGSKAVPAPTESRRAGPVVDAAAADEPPRARARALGVERPSVVARTPMWPVWVRGAGGEPELLLVRTVTVRDRSAIQGVWLDWAGLRARLLGAVADVAPEATLTPVIDQAAAPRALMLASVPALLETPAPAMPRVAWAWTPTRVTLVVTWIAVIGAVGAIGLVLRASIRLGERRGRFVSAVTHELRTPLTTFCLYTDMLAQDMVADERARGEYLRTLRRESQRLARIVENVLAYARIGSRRRPRRAGAVTARSLVERIAPVIENRVAQEGFTLGVEADEGALDSLVGADPEVVERILSNLADNACKYAAGAEDRSLVLRVAARPRGVEFRFRDHGPGVSSADRNAIFGAFSRGRHDDAIPGLGLGLALARALAREMGGDLRLAPTSGAGAEFVLSVARAVEG